MARGTRWRNGELGAKVFTSLVIVAGAGVLLYSTAHLQSINIAEFVCYLLIALLASQLRVSLPAMTDTLSVNFLFVLVGVLDLSLTETLMLGCAGVMVQCLYGERTRPVRVAFNICCSALSIALAYGTYHSILSSYQHARGIRPLMLGLAATVYFVVNTGALAALVALSERRSLRRIWVGSYRWSFPYYLGAAALASFLGWLNRSFQWQSSLLALPLVYLIHRSIRLYVGKLDGEKRHIAEMADLHMRTIEALALAIEAKDHTTHDHLQRVRIYALEVGKEMGLSAAELEALQAASLLHDIGKLAVPEHIISKPGTSDPGRI